MTLVSEAELKARYNYFNTYSSDNITGDILLYAEDYVNARLAKAYDTPFSVGHPTVKDLIIDCAYYRAVSTRSPSKAAEMRDYIEGRFKALCDGDEYIITGSGYIEPNAGESSIWSTTKDYHPTHSMLDDDLSFISSDRLQDEMDERDIY